MTKAVASRNFQMVSNQTQIWWTFKGMFKRCYGKHGNKGYIGIKRVMSRINIHVFISFYNGSFLCIIFKIWTHCFLFGPFFIVGIAILSRINVDCVFLASTLNSILVLLEVLSQYLATVIITGVCRTLSNMMELFVKTRNDIFSSIIPFWQCSENASGHDTVILSSLISFQNLLRIAIKRKRSVTTSHLANSFKKSKKRYINGCCTEHATTNVSKWEKTVKDVNWKNCGSIQDG